MKSNKILVVYKMWECWFLLKLSYALTNIINPCGIFNAISLNPTYSRDEDLFLLSKIFEKSIADEEDENHLSEKYKQIIENQFKLFATLKINKFSWDYSSYFKKHKAFLQEHESKYYQAASIDASQKFNDLQQFRKFPNIDQLELAIKTKLDNKYFSFANLTKNNKEVEQEIVKFYNFIINSHILNLDSLLQSVYEFKIDNELLKLGADGMTSGNFYKNDFLTIVSFIEDWNEKNRITREFNLGWTTNKNLINTFIHEMSHAIFFIYNMEPLTKEHLNLRIMRPSDASTWDKITDFNFSKKFGNKVKIKPANHNRVAYVALNFIYKKFNVHNANDAILMKLAKWTAVPGMYGRTPLINEEDDEDDEDTAIPCIDTEWLVEAFTYYYLTPINERNKIWELWHQFFTLKLPDYL